MYWLNNRSYKQKLVIILKTNFIWNGDKLPIQFPKLGRSTQIYFKKKFALYNLQWKDIYTLSCKVTINAYLRPFQYKMLNNVLYLNKKLHTIGLSNTQLRYFCKMDEETISRLFYYCSHIQDFWNQVQAYFTDCTYIF